MDQKNKWWCIDVQRAISLFFSAYFLYAFHLNVGFPPSKDISSTSITYLALFVFFLLLPFAKKLKLGKLLEYEAKVDEVKKEVKEFKEETRQILSMQNTLINTVSNTISQNINITMPGLNEAQDAKQQLNETIKEPEQPEVIEDEINEFLASEGSDLNFALAKLRMEIERELRRILGKRTQTSEPTRMKGKFLSARSLFKEFTMEHPEYKGMYGSFDYILKVCNAAIHGQSISQEHAHEALYMGLRMLDELKKVNGE